MNKCLEQPQLYFHGYVKQFSPVLGEIKNANWPGPSHLTQKCLLARPKSLNAKMLMLLLMNLCMYIVFLSVHKS